MQNGSSKVQEINKNLIQKVFGQDEKPVAVVSENHRLEAVNKNQNLEEQEEFDDNEDDDNNYLDAETIDEKEQLSLEAKEIELIKKSLDRNKGKRKAAADEPDLSLAKIGAKFCH